MTNFNMYEVKTNLSKILEILENKEDDCVIISGNGKPVLKVVLYENNSRDNLIGCAKGLFKIPDNFDDIDLESDFEEEIFPRFCDSRS